MKSSVKNRSPQHFSHLGLNVQGLQQQHRRNKSLGRQYEIEIQNNALINNMLNIMHRGTRSNHNSPQNTNLQVKSMHHFRQAQLPGGGIPLSQTQQISFSQNEDQQYNQNRTRSMNFNNTAQSLSRIGSLNYFKRKKEMRIINQTNEQLLKALQEVRPVVSRDDFRTHENRINKLKQHIGTVRYGALSNENFVYPEMQQEQENHNYHSSQFVFVKNPSYLNIKSSSQLSKNNRSQIQLNRTYGNPQTRPITSYEQTRERMNRSNQSSDYMQIKKSKTPQSNIRDYDQMSQEDPLAKADTGGPTDTFTDQKFDNILNEKMKLKKARKKKLSKNSNIFQQSRQSSPQKKTSKSPELNKSQIGGRKQISPQSAKSITQGAKQSIFSKKALEINNVFQRQYMSNQKLQAPQANNYNMNPYSQISAMKEKFVKPEQIQDYNQSYLQSTNLVIRPQTTYASPARKVIKKSDIIMHNQKNESSIKFIEPKIQVNLIDADQNDSNILSYHPQNMNMDMFYNSSINIQNSSPSSNQSPQHFFKSANLSPDFAQSNNDKGYRMQTQSPPSVKQGVQPIINVIQAPDMEGVSGQGQRSLIRTNTRYSIPLDEKTPQFLNKTNMSETKLMSYAANAFRKARVNKARVDTNVRTFIKNLKKAVTDTRRLKDLKQTQTANRVFTKLFNLPQTDKPQESISINYSQESFPEALDEKLIYDRYLEEDSLKKHIQQEITSKHHVSSVVTQAQLQLKVQKLTKKFIELLKDKVNETKQRKVATMMFAKQLRALKSKKTEESKQDVQNPQNDIEKQKQGGVKSMMGDLIGRFQRNQQISTQSQAKNYRQSFEQMSDVSKQIVNSFFKYLWKQVRLRNIQRQFITNLRYSARTKKQVKDEKVKVIAGFTNKFMMMSAAMFVEERDSLSVHYSDDESIGSPGFSSCSKPENQDNQQILDNQQIVQSYAAAKVLEEEKENQAQQQLAEQLRQEEIAKKQVKNYLSGLRNRMKNKSQTNQVPKKKPNAFAMFSQVIQENKSTIKIQEYKVGMIQDKEFIDSTFREFKRLFIRLFQLNAKQRQSRIHVLYFASEFRQRVLLLLKKSYKKLKNDEDIGIKKQIQAYIYLNELRLKYQQQKGMYKAKIYLCKLKYKAQQRKALQNLIKFHMSSNKTNEAQKVQKMKQIIARLMQQKPFIERIKCNPFKNNIVLPTLVMEFIAQMFINKRNLVGRPYNPFRKGVQITQRKIEIYFALQFQQKRYLQLIKAQHPHVVNETKALILAQALQKGAQKHEKAFEHFHKIGNASPVISSNNLHIGMIEDIDFKLECKHHFRGFLVRLFQLSSKQRSTRIHILYLARDFYRNVFQSLEKAFLKIKKDTPQEKALHSQVKSYLFLNRLKLKYQHQKGQYKAVQLINRLRYKAQQNKGLRELIQFHMKNIKTQREEKIRNIKQIVCQLFQQHTFQESIRYNPFSNNATLPSQVKEYIAHMYLNKRNVVGRPYNPFRHKESITKSNVIKFFALQFQIKKYHSEEQSKKQRALKLAQAMKQGSQQQNLRQGKALDFKISKSQLKAETHQIQIGDIKDEVFSKATLKSALILIAKLFQLNPQQRQTKIHVQYMAREFQLSIITYLKEVQPRLTADQQELKQQVKAYIYLNELRLKYQQQKGLYKAKLYLCRLRYKAQQSKSLKNLILFHMRNGKTNDVQKRLMLKYIISLLFQQHTFEQSIKFDPFKNNILQPYQVKDFIANLFQNKRNLIGRPISPFTQDKRVTTRKIRNYIALQFQQKKHLWIQQAFNPALWKFRKQILVKRFIRKLQASIKSKKSDDFAAQLMQMVNKNLALDYEDTEEEEAKVEESLSFKTISNKDEAEDYDLDLEQDEKQGNNFQPGLQKATTQAFGRQNTQAAKQVKGYQNANIFIQKVKQQHDHKDETVKKVAQVFKKNLGKVMIIEEDCVEELDEESFNSS